MAVMSVLQAEAGHAPWWARVPGEAADAIAAACSGNFDPGDSMAKRGIQLVQRAWLCLCWIHVTALTSLAEETNWLSDPAGRLQIIIWAIFPWIIITVDLRFRDSECMRLLQTTSSKRLLVSQRKSALGTALRGLIKLVIVGTILPLALMRVVMFCANPKVGIVLGATSMGPFVIGCMGMCDVICKVGQWVAASVCAIEGFGDDVAGALTAGTTRRVPTRQVSVVNAAGGVIPEAIMPKEPDDDKCQPSRMRKDSTGSQQSALVGITIGKFESAYDEAAAVVNTMNAIFSGPVTVLVVTACMIVALMVLFTLRRPDEQGGKDQLDGLSLGFAVIMLICILVLLAWLASAGDVSIRVSRVLLSPHCFLSLAASLNREDPCMGEYLIVSLQSTVLGFEIYNVTLTSQNVLYILGSILFGLVFAFAPLLAAYALGREPEL